MKIIAIGDLHGSLPEIPECDLLLIAGDVCPVTEHELAFQRHWLDEYFRDWLNHVPAKHIIGIAGNHDFIFADKYPKDLPWEYLQDQATEYEGLKIYGTPWVPNLPRWAFHSGMGGVAQYLLEEIPWDLDILLSHGPPRGFGDHVGAQFGDKPVGCLTMRDALRFLRPKVFVCGHIHEARGHYRHPYVLHGVYNVAHMDENYEIGRGPVEIDV